MYGGDCDAAIAKAAAAVTRVQSQSQEVGSGDGRAGLLSRNGLLVAGGRAVETSSIFVFRMTFYVHRGSCQGRVYPRRGLSLSSREKHSNLKGGIDVSSAIPRSIRLFEELFSLLVNRRSGVNRFCKKYRIWCDMTT